MAIPVAFARDALASRREQRIGLRATTGAIEQLTLEQIDIDDDVAIVTGEGASRVQERLRSGDLALRHPRSGQQHELASPDWAERGLLGHWSLEPFQCGR